MLNIIEDALLGSLYRIWSHFSRRDAL